MNRNTKGACKTHSNKTISRHISVLQAPDSSYAKSSSFTNSCKMKPALRVLGLSEAIPSDPLPSLPVHPPAHSIQLNILMITLLSSAAEMPSYLWNTCYQFFSPVLFPGNSQITSCRSHPRFRRSLFCISYM